MKSRLIFSLLGLPRGIKRLLAVILDAMLCLWSFWASLYLRYGEWVPLVDTRWIGLGVAMLLALTIFELFGLYRSVFRHSGGSIDLSLLRACLTYGAIYSAVFAFVGIAGIPRTVGMIQPTLLFLSVAASRTIIFALLAHRNLPSGQPFGGGRVLIYGAGNAGRHLAQVLRGERAVRPTCFVDDDPSLQGAHVLGLKVYRPDQMREVITAGRIDKVLLALPAAARRRRREIVHELRGCQVEIRTLPGLGDIVNGDVRMIDVRPLTINDLLGRQPVAPDEELLRHDVAARTVVVTGAGGSIGSELSRQILLLGPARLLLIDSSEFALYAIHRELTGRVGAGAATEIIPILALAHDAARINAIFERYCPQTIYHAAAYKHVPLVEHNCLEGLRNNVLGTDTVARIAEVHRAESFVLISTDKAVRPTNVMGASKRWAEQIIQARAASGSTTRFSVVRFGNVLGSSGSVVPLFEEQIAKGGPLTITHREVTRFFMTIPEAAQLVLQAGAMGKGGEVFVLDMGEPIKVYDLAINMIELSGLSQRSEQNPDGDIEIEIVGLRPGEKLFEELLIGNDPQSTSHPRIMRAHEGHMTAAELDARLDRLRIAIEQDDLPAALALLKECVPEYQANGPIVDLLYSARPHDPAVEGSRQPTQAAASLFASYSVKALAIRS